MGGRVCVALLALLLAVGAGCRRKRGTAFEGYAFVAARGSGTLAVVDLASFSLVKQIRLPARPQQIVADAARRALYVMGDGGPTGLISIDTQALEARRSVWLAEKPLRLRLSADGARLYVIDGRSEERRVGKECRL